MSYVALLRGLNVGRANRIKMDALRHLAEGIGWRDVRHYLQSGNLLFEAKAPRATALEAALAQAGIASEVVILQTTQLKAALEALPYGTDRPKQVHLYFAKTPLTLTADPAPFAEEGAQACARDGVVYLHTPGGMGRSKLAAKLPSLLSEPATGRNLSTMRALVEMAG